MSNEEEPKLGDTKPSTADNDKQSEEKKSLWQSIPVIIKAITGLILAIGSLATLVTALDNAGIIGVDPTVTPTPTYTFMPSPTATITPSPTATETPSPSPTITITPSPSQTLSPSPSPSPTLSPTITPTPEVATQLELCLINSNNNIVVRNGPDINTNVMGQLSPNTCLNFDLRQFDNSWIRIAAEQSSNEAQAVALGWLILTSINTTSMEIEHLAAYIPEDARNGLYCVRTDSGSRVRECPGTDCNIAETLPYRACVFFDGRLADSSWLRVAGGQEGLSQYWVLSNLLIVEEFLEYVEKPRMQPYMELLPIVTPPPTPGG